MSGGYSVITTMKNEGAFLIEWVAHYKALGFDRLLICTNDCADPTARMAARLEAMGLARHHPTRVWPAAGIQRSALRQARWYPEVTDAEWLFVCDADEFLVIHDGDGSVRHLARGAGGAEVVTVSWRSFGPDGRVDYDERPVTRQFTRAEADPGPNPRRPTYGKSLFRGDADIHRIGIHGPVAGRDLGRDLHRVFPGGRPYRAMGNKILIAPEYGHAQVNHYALRALDSFLVKRDRGRVNHTGKDMGLDYWKRFDRAEVACDAIRRYDPVAEAWRADLHRDPLLGALHREAVAWHRARSRALRADPAWAELVASLLARLAPSQAPSGRTDAAGPEDARCAALPF